MSTLNFEYEVESGEETLTLFVEVKYNVAYDPGYGADTDGNRGMKSWFLDDMSFKVMRPNANGKGEEDITDFVKDTLPDTYQDIMTEAEDRAMDTGGMNEDEDDY